MPKRGQIEIFVGLNIKNGFYDVFYIIMISQYSTACSYGLLLYLDIDA